MKIKILSFFILLLTLGCESDELTDDQILANDIWEEIQGYKTWDQNPEFLGIQSGDSPHGEYVQIWINDIVKEFFNVEIPDSLLPNGSIIVKEGYSDEGGANMNKITVMKKINGFDPDHNNWFWANYNENGSLGGKNGKVSSCYSCHASGKDYILSRIW
tara:strand:+ start:1771 stop:2247 length:477 start_codon:yes stop_codon:yes gene_type:complete